MADFQSARYHDFCKTFEKSEKCDKHPWKYQQISTSSSTLRRPLLHEASRIEWGGFAIIITFGRLIGDRIAVLSSAQVDATAYSRLVGFYEIYGRKRRFLFLGRTQNGTGI